MRLTRKALLQLLAASPLAALFPKAKVVEAAPFQGVTLNDNWYSRGGALTVESLDAALSEWREAMTAADGQHVTIQPQYIVHPKLFEGEPKP
jgi:hypothetical protein